MTSDLIFTKIFSGKYRSKIIDETQNQLKDSTASIILTTSKNLNKIISASKECPQLKVICLLINIPNFSLSSYSTISCLEIFQNLIWEFLLGMKQSRKSRSLIEGVFSNEENQMNGGRGVQSRQLPSPRGGCNRGCQSWHNLFVGVALLPNFNNAVHYYQIFSLVIPRRKIDKISKITKLFSGR